MWLQKTIDILQTLMGQAGFSYKILKILRCFANLRSITACLAMTMATGRENVTVKKDLHVFKHCHH